MMAISNTSEPSVRPLSARSAIASTLLGTHPPTLPAAVLVRSCEILGVSSGTARVALSRMVAKNELTVEGGRYTLAGSLLARQRRQDESLAATSDYDGRWSMFIVQSTAEPRSPAERLAVRNRFRNFRYGPIRDGVWARPANLANFSEAFDALHEHADHWLSTPDDPVTMIAGLWDIRNWALRATRLQKAMTRGFGGLERDDTTTLKVNFALDAAVIRHLHADPLLPSTLLPKTWPGEQLRRQHATFDAAFNRVWRTELRRDR